MIFLISEKTLKQYSLLNDSIDVQFINPAIQLAQDIKLQQVIGSRLVNKICSCVANETLRRVNVIAIKNRTEDTTAYIDADNMTASTVYSDPKLDTVIGKVVGGSSGYFVVRMDEDGSEVYYDMDFSIPQFVVDNTRYKALLDGDVKNYLVYQTMVEIQPMLYAKFRNAGMVNSQDTQTQQVALNDIKYLTDYYQDKADWYANRLNTYLCHNHSKFQEYSHSFANGEIGAKHEDYSCPIEL